MTGSLYDRVGGFRAVSRIVLSFYEKVLESDLVAPYFSAIDMKRLIDHQTKFVCSIMGGPASFSDEQIRIVHSQAGISAAAFDEIVALFEDALEEAALDPADVAAMVAVFQAKRPLVVSP